MRKTRPYRKVERPEDEKVNDDNTFVNLDCGGEESGKAREGGALGEHPDEEHPESESEEIQCSRCCATVLPTDEACAVCGQGRFPPEEVETRTYLKPARGSTDPDANPKGNEYNLEKSDPMDPGNSTAHPVFAGLPWKGGTLMPPPPPVAVAQGVGPAPAPTAKGKAPKTKPTTSYMAWVKAHKKEIAVAANKPGDLKAFGAEAGRRWRNLTQAERDSYKNIPDAKPLSPLDDPEAEQFPDEECETQDLSSPCSTNAPAPTDTASPPASSPAVPTPAQHRMMLLRERVLAKERCSQGEGIRAASARPLV